MLGTSGFGLDFVDSAGATIGGSAAGAGNVVVGANNYDQAVAMVPGSYGGPGCPNALIQ